MQLVKTLAAAALCALVQISCAAVCSADVVINKITPREAAGIFEKGQNVSFDISYKASGGESVTYTVSDIHGREFAKGSVNLDGTSGTAELKLQKYNPGWYRVRFYELGSEEDIYCAFSVVEPYSSRYTGKNPFAADQAGQYTDWTAEERAGYARALRLAGIDIVRERMSDYTDEEYDPYIAEQADALRAEGISVMEMLAKNSFIDYDEDLFSTYNKAKKNAEIYFGSVGAWESVNEADADGRIAPDEAASYYKARAIGIVDAGSGAVKTFGGLCNWNTSFSEVFMQNDVMSYADVYNLHSHRTAEQTEYNYFPSDPVFEGRELSTVYGGGKPVWVSESGMSCPVDENDIILDDYMELQAKYVITSTVESIARGGTDKHFWFLFRHYIENGREFGIFSKNHMPYAAYSSLAALTYYLGEGTFLGELRECPDNCVGYMFSDGENDVAVVWNKEDKTDYVQFNTTRDAEVTDLVGDNVPVRYSEVNEKINIPVTDSPVIVKFNGRTENNYFSKSFPQYETLNVSSMPDNKRIVLKQTWLTKKVVNSKYVMEQGKNYVIALNVYNFSDKTSRGEIRMSLSDNLKAVSPETASYTVSGGGKTVVTFIVAADSSYSTGGTGYISFDGTSNGMEISPSVSECDIPANDGAMSVSYFDGYNNKNSWSPNSVGSMTVTEPASDTVKFKFDFAANVSDRWAHPKLRVDGGVLADAAGIAFKTLASEAECDISSMNIKVFAWTSDGSAYIIHAGPCVSGTEAYRLTWDKFTKFSGSGGETINPADITEISVGFNAGYTPGSASYSYAVKELGYFSGESYKPEEPEIEITGISNRTKYIANTNKTVYAKMPEGLDNYAVYLDYAPAEFSEEEYRTLTIPLESIKEGAHILTVTGFDKFNRAVRKSITFYAADVSNIFVEGTFFE